MKSIILGLIYLATFMFTFFALSFIGLLWNNNYYEVISCPGWFVVYTVVMCYPVHFPAGEYYYRHKDYFEKVL